MLHRLIQPMALALVLTSAPGCTSMDDLDAAAAGAETDIGARSLALGGSKCPEGVCGDNAGSMYGFPFTALAPNGAATRYGAVVTHMTGPSGESLELTAEDGQLFGTGRNASPGKKDNVLEGAELEGSVIEVDLGGSTHHIHILRYIDDVEYDNQPGVTFPSYQLAWTPPPGWLMPPNLCNPPAIDDPGFSFDADVVIITDESYDPNTITRDVFGVNGEFRIACSGSAAYDMVRMGYDPRLPATHPSYTTPDQRQATLKMLLADYCGTGHSFTVKGEKLLWQNAAGWFDVPPGQVDEHEAAWGPDGAFCLDTPRREYAVPDIKNQIAAECGSPLPACITIPNPWPEWSTYIPY